MSTYTGEDDELYLKLKGARERLCVCQTLVGSDAHRRLLQEALDRIDLVGALTPQWSRHDLPTLPDPT